MVELNAYLCAVLVNSFSQICIAANDGIGVKSLLKDMAL